MPFKIIKSIGGAATLLASGCSALGGNVTTKSLDVSGATVVSYEANRRGAYFADTDKKVGYCAEPPPDIALNKALEAAASGEFKDVSAELTAKLSSSAIELAGRSQLVLLARELLYRTCEMSLNGTLNNEQINDNYAKVLALVENLGKTALVSAETERNDAEKALAEAETENIRQKLLLNQQISKQ